VISARDMQKRSVLFMKHLKEIPAFATENEEKAFWLTHDSAESLD
jgi:hypothetical protein